MTDPDPADTEPTLANVGELLDQLRPRLERMVALRMDHRLNRRIDTDDVLQEAFVLVTRRLPDYLAQRPMAFFLWVRLLTGQTIVDLHRRHLGAARRDAAREITPGMPAPSTMSLAGVFVDPHDTPAEEAARLEALDEVRAALERLDENDREVLALRYFERLSNEETASVLGLTDSGAKKRHVRALKKLRTELPRLSDVPTP